MTRTLRCPAAEMEHGVQSLHVADVRCRLSGLAQGAADAPCTSDGYCRCPLWTAEKQRLWQLGHANRSDRILSSDGETWVAA